jgi:hypothetical protein
LCPGVIAEWFSGGNMLMSVIFFDLAETLKFLCGRTSTIITCYREMPLVLGEGRLATKVRRRRRAL